MFANARGEAHDLGIRIGRAVDHHMAERFRQGDEIPFRIDHDLLDEGGAFLEDSAQQMRLARAAVPLDQQARGKEFFDIQFDRRPDRIGAKHDLCGHRPPSSRLGASPNPRRGVFQRFGPGLPAIRIDAALLAFAESPVRALYARQTRLRTCNFTIASIGSP